MATATLARAKESGLIDGVRQTVEKGDKGAVNQLISKAGLKWEETGEFDLSSALIPKLGEAKEIMPAVMRQWRGGGLVKTLIPFQGSFLIVDVTQWKEVADTNTAEVEGVDRMVAYRKAEGAIEAWAKEVQAKASITKNPRLTQ